MSELNEAQELIATTLDGMMVVDAGPGTGKTHTIVERYINLISRPDVSPKDVLLLTFTNNASAEMDERIKRKMSELGMEKDSKLVQTKTFDAFCLSLVLDSADLVSDFFGIKEKLTRAATMHQNDALNRDYFTRFMDGFLQNRGSDYGDISIIASEDPISVMHLIYNLMSKGLMPLKHGWFGSQFETVLNGDTEFILESLRSNNTVGSRGACKNLKPIRDIGDDMLFDAPVPQDSGALSDEDLVRAAEDDREVLFRFVHDVYHAYISQSIADNRLTFGLTAMFAYAALYSNQSIRDRNSFRYLMVDEFQDTNANQMMISLMILKESNMCVVGDWKQGIYGFRYVSIENITDFERKAVEYRRFLVEDGKKRVLFRIPEVPTYPLDKNYRSSQRIIDKAFQCICLKASEDDDVG